MTIPRNSVGDVRRAPCGTMAPPDPSKTAVMRWIAQLATDGLAEWELLANGHIRLRFDSGETYLFADFTIHRVA